MTNKEREILLSHLPELTADSESARPTVTHMNKPYHEFADSESAHTSGSNINLLSEAEWRTIHNALAVYQCTTCDATRRKQLQTLMNKIRDEYIAPYQQTESIE